MKKRSYPIKTIFYRDELNDEFSGVQRDTKEIDENYRYINQNMLWKMASVIVHRFFVTPFAYLYCRIKFGFKICNKEVLKPFLQSGCFLYGNHTQVPGDGFMQAMTVFPQKSYVIVNADNVSLKGTEQLMLMIGCIPLPSSLGGYRNFLAALHERVSEGHPIVIYPEAHIWPYFTGIRPFLPTSFSYPVKENKPVFAFTATYKQRKWCKTPKIVMYVDGPFFPDLELKTKPASEKLRNQVYEAMCYRASENDCEYYSYQKLKEEEKLYD